MLDETEAVASAKNVLKDMMCKFHIFGDIFPAYQ